MNKITHEQAMHVIETATVAEKQPTMRAYITQQKDREAADRVLLDRCFQLLTYLDLDDEPIVERLRARLGKENSNGN